MNAYRHTELDYRTLILGNLSLLEWDYSLSWGDVPHPSRLLPADGLVNSIRALHFWHTKQGCAGPLRAQGNIASPKGAEGRKNYRWREMWPVTWCRDPSKCHIPHFQENSPVLQMLSHQLPCGICFLFFYDSGGWPSSSLSSVYCSEVDWSDGHGRGHGSASPVIKS